MLVSELDYFLPPALIATQPVQPRDHSRLMVYHRGSGQVEHRRFFDIVEYLRPADVMVVNDTRVLPAKLLLHRQSGAFVPGLFVEELQPGVWEVMLRSRGKVKIGDVLQTTGYTFKVLARAGTKGQWRVQVSPCEPAREILEHIGHVPLPPYIEKARGKNAGVDESRDRTQYQTVYAHEGRSLAAPTAGLHFTTELLARIEAKSVRRAPVELDVGLGTFLPMETDTVEAHPMHAEKFHIPAQTIAQLRHRPAGARIVVVGTTAVRTLEAAAAEILDASVPPHAISGTTQLKILPGYDFRLTDILLTNFHLPRSTLLALVGALAGLDQLKALYMSAVCLNYRFYSYGDAMLILP